MSRGRVNPRLVSIPLLFAGIGLLAACSGGLSENDEEFVSTVSTKIADRSADDLVAQAQSACEGLEAGTKPLPLYLNLLDRGFSSEEAQALLIGAAIYYCSDYEQDIVMDLYTFNTQ